MYMRPLFYLTLLTVGNVGAVVSPIITFNPDWNKVFKGESINLTYDVDFVVDYVIYHWFKDGYWIRSGKTFSISSAQTSDTGNYQCQTSTGDKSDSARLDVYNGYVILRTSPYVYEGDNLTLRCSHFPGYLAKQTIFYKNNAVIKGWGPEDELHIKNVDVTSSSRYKCTKQVNHNLLYYQHSDEISLSIQELFSLPAIRVSPPSVTEGNRVTLTCHTTLSPLRQTTLLQFAFYHNGQNIQEFSSSNKYEIPSAKQWHSGDYKCEVKTSNYQMKKMSTIFTIHAKKNSEQGTSPVITTVSVTVLVLVLIVAGLNFLYRTKSFLPADSQRPSKMESKEPEEKTENIYTDPNMNNSWQYFSQSRHTQYVNNLATKNLFIDY